MGSASDAKLPDEMLRLRDGPPNQLPSDPLGTRPQGGISAVPAQVWTQQETAMKKLDTILPIAALTAVTLFVAVNWQSIWRDTTPPPKPQTILNLDEMARQWNATSPYFMATSNHVTVQDTTSYGVTTLKVKDLDLIVDTAEMVRATGSILFELRSNNVPVVSIKENGTVEYDTNNVGEATRFFWQELSWHLRKTKHENLR